MSFKLNSQRIALASWAGAIALTPLNANAMHIMEGFLPPTWALTWWALFIPFVVLSVRNLKQIVSDDSSKKVLLALCGAFIFVLSALKLPSVTGSCSHPTGVGLAVILFGFLVVPVLGGIALLFQALLLAHGGISTLGANGMSMAVIGPMLGYAIWVAANKMNLRKDVSVFLVAFVADIATYAVTSLQLGAAFPDPQLGVMASVGKFMSIFLFTQFPIAIAEGLLTVLIYEQLTKRSLVSFQERVVR